MMDTVDATTRSRIMASVSSKNTKPERVVRSKIHSQGFRFRLHDKKLPGNPDLVFKRYRTAIFVHGCFWHGHDCKRGRRPSSNVEFWNAKLDKNVERDRWAITELKKLGWDVVVIWECDLGFGIQSSLELLNAKRCTS